jgi:hypothetical protein
LGKFNLIVNPILDNSWGFANLDFAPSARIAYNLTKTWAVAVERYSDFGVVKQFLPSDQQSQQTFAVVDYKGEIYCRGRLGFWRDGSVRSLGRKAYDIVRSL